MRSYQNGISNMLDGIRKSGVSIPLEGLSNASIVSYLDAVSHSMGDTELIRAINYWLRTRMGKGYIVREGGEERELSEFQLGIIENGQCPFDGANLITNSENVGFNEPGAEKIEITYSCPECGREL